MSNFIWEPSDLIVSIDKDIHEIVLYHIYSIKDIKLGTLDIYGSLVSTNKKLQQVYQTLLIQGVYTYDIQDNFVSQKLVTKQDGDIFVEALTYNLNLLGFIIKKEIRR